MLKMKTKPMTRLRREIAVPVCCLLLLVVFFLVERNLPSNKNDTTFGRFNVTASAGGALVFPESALAHRLLDGLKGIEIGAAAHNPYGLDTLNVDYTDELTIYSNLSMDSHKTGPAKVDLVAPGDRLPFTNDSIDFVISSHVLEHFYDPIGAIQEWLRVVKPGGFVYMDIPHKERTPDMARPRTTLEELLRRHSTPTPPRPNEVPHGHHYSVWVPQDLLDLCAHFKWNVVEWRDMDDKTGDAKHPSVGFTIVLKKE